MTLHLSLIGLHLARSLIDQITITPGLALVGAGREHAIGWDITLAGGAVNEPGRERKLTELGANISVWQGWPRTHFCGYIGKLLRLFWDWLPFTLAESTWIAPFSPSMAELASGEEYNLSSRSQWETLRIGVGNVIEVELLTSSFAVDEEEWAALLVTQVQVTEDGSLVLAVRFLCSMDPSTGERLAGQLEGSGHLHLCREEPCHGVERRTCRFHSCQSHQIVGFFTLHGDLRLHYQCTSRRSRCNEARADSATANP